MSEKNKSNREGENIVINITNLSECYYCRKSPLKITDIICPSCGFPQRGTPEEQKKFIVGKRSSIVHEEELNGEIRKVQFSLFGVALVILINFLPSAFKTNPINLISWVVFDLIFVGLGMWAKKKPYAAIVTGIIFYFLTLIYLTNDVAYNTGLPFYEVLFYYGYLWKLLILGSFAFGFNSAQKIKKLSGKSTAKKI